MSTTGREFLLYFTESSPSPWNWASLQGNRAGTIVTTSPYAQLLFVKIDHGESDGWKKSQGVNAQETSREALLELLRDVLRELWNLIDWRRWKPLAQGLRSLNWICEPQGPVSVFQPSRLRIAVVRPR